MIKLLIVGSGGFLGSILRYSVCLFTSRIHSSHPFPFGTLSVNVIGCFIIALLAGLAVSKVPLTHETRLFLLVGLLGGFTTFSTFGHETLTLVKSSLYLHALGNVTANVLVGFGAILLGDWIAKAF